MGEFTHLQGCSLRRRGEAKRGGVSDGRGGDTFHLDRSKAGTKDDAYDYTSCHAHEKRRLTHELDLLVV